MNTTKIFTLLLYKIAAIRDLSFSLTNGIFSLMKTIMPTLQILRESYNRGHEEPYLDTNKVWGLAQKDLLVVCNPTKYKEQSMPTRELNTLTPLGQEVKLTKGR